jgi:hypothetical protein
MSGEDNNSQQIDVTQPIVPDNPIVQEPDSEGTEEPISVPDEQGSDEVPSEVPSEEPTSDNSQVSSKFKLFEVRSTGNDTCDNICSNQNRICVYQIDSNNNNASKCHNIMIDNKCLCIDGISAKCPIIDGKEGEPYNNGKYCCYGDVKDDTKCTNGKSMLCPIGGKAGACLKTPIRPPTEKPSIDKSQ